MSRHGEDIQTCPIRRSVATGIAYTPVVPGLVAYYEEREAAVYCHYTPEHFAGLPLEERAACVAQYRLHNLVENHIQDALTEASRRR